MPIYENEQIANLHRECVAARSAYESYVRADPEMLAATDEAERLRRRIADTWNAYYYTRYPDGPPKECNHEIV